MPPIRLKMDITDEKIDLTYQGAEIGERGEILNEVVNILGEKGERGVKEIQEELHGILTSGSGLTL